MFEIAGKQYYIDINRVASFANHSDTHKLVEREIVDNYECKHNGDGTSRLDNTTKTVREVSSQGNTNMDNIKYDLLKLFITQLIGYGLFDDNDEEGTEESIPFGIALCMNTLIKEKILIEY